MCNLDPNEKLEVVCELRGTNKTRVSGTILTATEMNAMNTFDTPNKVAPALFDSAKIADNKLTVSLPAKSVVVLEVC